MTSHLYFDSGETLGPPSRFKISFSSAARFSIVGENYHQNIDTWIPYDSGVTIREECLDDLIEALQKLKKLYVLK